MKEFFLISQVFYPDEVSTANLFTKLCSIIAENEKVNVKVWCAQPSYSCEERQAKHLIYNNIEITFLTSTNFRKNLLIGRLINYLTFTISVVLRLLFTKDKTPVFTHTTPPSLGIIIAFICKWKKRKFNYVLLDIFPDGLVRLGKLKAENVMVRAWRMIHHKALQRCNYIIVIGRDMRSWLVKFAPDVADKIKYIPIWQDDELIKPKEFKTNLFVIKNGLENKFIVQYSGNMGLWNDMKSLGQLANQEIDDSVFMFLGGGMRKEELMQGIGENQKGNVLLYPFLSNNDYSDSVSACHVAIISMQKNLEGMAVPSKVMGIMAAGIPILAMVPKESEITYIINEEGCGIQVNPGDIEAMSNAIIRLQKNESLRIIMGEKGRKAFEKKYTAKHIAKKYISLIE